MNELLMILSAAMPEEMALEQLKSAIAEYEVNKNKETRGKVVMLCMLFTSKEMIDSTTGGLDSVLDKLDKAKKGFDLMDIKHDQ